MWFVLLSDSKEPLIHYVDEAGLELRKIHLPLPLKSWD